MRSCNRRSERVASSVPSQTKDKTSRARLWSRLRYLAARTSDFIAGFKDLVGHALVISLGVIMGKVRIDSSSQRVLTEEDYSFETFGLDTLHEPLEMRIQVWTPWWQLYWIDTFIVILHSTT